MWFPHLPTDQLRRHHARLGADIPPGPVVTARHDGRRRVVAAVDEAAHALGLRPGLAMAHARALVPNLHVAETEPDADAGALRRLALWCHRYTPLVAVEGAAGLWLDIAGCVGAFGTEAALLQHMLARFEANGFHARAALADTPGAAHALARFGAHGPTVGPTVVPAGEQGTAVAPLPVASLRLAPGMDGALRRLGFERVDDLLRIPRALLAQRFGPLVGLRLDQVRGDVSEPLAPLLPEAVRQQRAAFPEPLLTVEAFQAAAAHLVGLLCRGMERDGVGARRLDLVFERVDRSVAAIRIGTVRASRDARHLLRLLHERFDRLDPGEGVEAMHLLAPLTNPLRWRQKGADARDVAPLVDRLVNRLGHGRVYCTTPVQTALPERAAGKGDATLAEAQAAGEERPVVTPSASTGTASTREAGCPAGMPVRLVVVPRSPGPGTEVQVPPTPFPAPSRVRLVVDSPPSPEHGRACPTTAGVGSPASSVSDDPAKEQALPWKPRHRPDNKRHVANLTPWFGRWPAPPRLLSPPCPVQVIAEMPDQPPRAFTWRRHRHLVHRADGPERIGGEWWREDGGMDGVRDYFLVEDTGGQRFWLFRRSNGLHLGTGTLDWFLHGLF